MCLSHAFYCVLNLTATLFTFLAAVHLDVSSKFCPQDFMTEPPAVIAGQGLNLMCKLNVTCHRHDSSRLYIKLRRRNISKEFITVMSENTILVRIPRLTMEDNRQTLSCKVNVTDHSNNISDVVASKQLTVIEAPYRANMTCIDYQWRRLNCTWSYPSSFMIKYTRHATVRYANDDISNGYAKCDRYTNWTDHDRFFFSCEIFGSYYDASAPYSLKVTITIKKINHTTMYNYNVGLSKVRITKVHKMEAVTARPVSSDTVQLSWNFQFYYEPLLKFKVQYNASRWNTKAVTMFYQTSEYDRIKSVNISGLVPYTQYTFCVTAQPNSPAALYWSNPSNVARVTTPATVPVKAPTVPPGGYTWVSEFMVRIYWQALNDRDHNGRLVGYSIFHKNKPIFVNKADYYSDVKLHGSPPYVIDVRSVNNVGQSQQYSRLIVTTSSLVFINFGVETTQSKHIIHVLWRPPKMEQVIKGYVLYLCARTISLYCSGPVHYIEVEANRTSKMLDTELLFGSGANQIKVGIGVVTTATNQSDSYWGITWSKCIYHTSSEPHDVAGAVAPSIVLSNIQYSSVTVMWKHLTCDESKVWISNYLLRYCEGATCHKSGPVNISLAVFGNKYIRHKLTNLAPATEYTVSVVMINSNGGILHTERDNRKNFTTHDLMKIPDTDLSWDSSQVTITCPSPSSQLSRPVFVATYTVSGKEKNISSVCQTDQDQTLIKFDCSDTQNYLVNLSLHATYSGKVYSSKKPVTKRICTQGQRALATTVIVAIVISCLIGGACLVVLSYATRRFWIKECHRVPRQFHYPDEAHEVVREAVEETYRWERHPDFSVCAGVYSERVNTNAPSSAPLLCEHTSPSAYIKDKQHALLYHSMSTDPLNGTYSQLALLYSAGMQDSNEQSVSGGCMELQLLPTPNLQESLHLDSIVPRPLDTCDFQVVSVHVPSISETMRMRPNIFGDSAAVMLSTREWAANFSKEMSTVSDKTGRQEPEDNAKTGGDGGSHACDCKDGEGGSHTCDCKDGEGGSHTCDCKGGEGDSHACDCKGGEGDSHACDCKGGEGGSHACDCKGGECGPNATMITNDAQRVLSEDMSNSDDIDSLSPSAQCSVLSDRVKLGMVHQSCRTHDDGGYVMHDGVSDRSTIMAESDSGCERTSSSNGDSMTGDSGYTSPEFLQDLCYTDFIH